MTYSVDFPKKVVAFVKNGGGQTEAARRFDISLWCVRDGLARKDLQPQQNGISRHRKIDQAERLVHVREHSDVFLRERAQAFGVRISSMEYALKQMQVTHKKRR